MFLRYFADIGHPPDQVVEALLAAPSEWLTDTAHDSLGEGERLSTEVGLRLGGRRLQRRVDVSLGIPLRLPSATVIPVGWVDHSRATLFPKLRAEIEVVGMGRERCQLSINVRYEPPFGVLGTVADRALLHRVAEATVKDFLDRVALRIDRNIAAAAPHPTPAVGGVGVQPGAAMLRGAS